MPTPRIPTAALIALSLSTSLASGEDRTNLLIKYGKVAAEARSIDEPLPQLTATVPEATTDEALSAQKAYVSELSSTDAICGFKGAMVSAVAQESRGMDGPLSAVLLASGWIESTGDTSLKIREGGGPAIETEIGLILDEPVHDEIPDVAALKQNVRALVAVVELPASTKDWSLPTTIADIVAINVGSDRFIIGQPNKNLNLDLESLPIQLTHDGKVINDTTGGDANRGQWWNFLHQINHAVRQGYSLEAGHLIITGALGKINNTGPGDYIAGFGDLGTIRFTLKSP